MRQPHYREIKEKRYPPYNWNRCGILGGIEYEKDSKLNYEIKLLQEKIQNVQMLNENEEWGKYCQQQISSAEQQLQKWTKIGEKMLHPINKDTVQ